MVCTVCLDADNASRADSLEKKWLVPLAYLHLGLYLAGLFHIISISDYNYYEPTRLTPVFECMFFCSIFMMPTLLLYVMVWNIMNLIKRNMAGGEKKRVSEIERERGQLQQMKLEPMEFSGEPASGELQYKELSEQENPIVGEEVAAEYVGGDEW